MGSAVAQGRLWGRAAHDWAELQEPIALPLWQAMLDAAMVGPGARVLDAGCGAGGASVLAARRGAQVNGLDAADALVAIARLRVPDGDFRVGDLESLPYADETFDTVLVADVLSYVADPGAALHEPCRVCAPAGRVVVAVWDVSGGSTYQIVTVVYDLLPVPLDRQPSTVITPGVLEVLGTMAGLTLIDEGRVSCPLEYPDQETAWQAQVSTGSLQAVLLVIGAVRLKAAVLSAIAPYAIGSGRVRLENSYCWVAFKPGEAH